MVRHVPCVTAITNLPPADTMFRGSDIPRVLIIGGFLLLGACSGDAPTTPGAPGGAKADVIVENTTTTADSIVVNLRITPTGGWYAIGKSGVYFPPSSICDPATTSYGPTEWDQPCTPATGDVYVTARTTNDGVSSWIHFSPDLRFVPSEDRNAWVYLYMYSADVKAAPAEDQASIAERYRIFWMPTGETVGIDEALTDPTVATQFHWTAGWVYRRVKHFSGYQVGVGFTDSMKSDDLLGSDFGADVGIGIGM